MLLHSNSNHPRHLTEGRLRLVMFVGAFAAAVVGGVFGAFLNKIAPIA